MEVLTQSDWASGIEIDGIPNENNTNFLTSSNIDIYNGKDWKIPNYEIEKKMSEIIKKTDYTRVKWLGEIILFLIGIGYIIEFVLIKIDFVMIPIIIILLFAFLSCLANLLK